MLAVLATEVVHVAPPSADCSIRYPLIVPPPAELGAVHVKLTFPLPAVATTERGAVAKPDGVAVAVALATPVPNALTALTRNVYAVPLVRFEATYTVDGEPVEDTRVAQLVPPSVLDSMK